MTLTCNNAYNEVDAQSFGELVALLLLLLRLSSSSVDHFLCVCVCMWSAHSCARVYSAMKFGMREFLKNAAMLNKILCQCGARVTHIAPEAASFAGGLVEKQLFCMYPYCVVSRAETMLQGV